MVTAASRDPRPPLTYRGAGVDITAKAGMLNALAPAITATYSEDVAAGLGAFAGALRLPHSGAGFLVATVDGVGTKTLLARRLGRDAVIGWDVVAHGANDLAACGARPVAFLDYIAMGRLDPALVGTLVEAIAGACRSLGVPLLGGETAELPDVYAPGAYEVVGTMLGLAPDGGLLTGSAIAPGDRLIGLASTGLHTNGYSLARRALEAGGASLDDPVDELGATPGEALLAPHRCYVESLLSLAGRISIRAAAHITGGGLADNLVRVLPEGRRAQLVRRWPEPPIFGWLARIGGIPEDEMVRTFNLGIGMVVVTAPEDAAAAVRHLEEAGVPAHEIGEVVEGPRGLDLR